MEQNNTNEGRMTRVEVELENIKSLLTSLNDKFDNLNVAYVPRMEINGMFQVRDDRIQQLTNEVTALKTERQNNKALIPAWVGIVISVISVVVMLITIFA